MSLLATKLSALADRPQYVNVCVCVCVCVCTYAWMYVHMTVACFLLGTLVPEQ